MKATGLSKCPVDGCTKFPAPIMCSEHWPKVSSPTRRALIQTFRALNGKGGMRAPPGRLVELLIEAVEDAA